MNSEIIEKLKVEQADLIDKSRRLYLFNKYEKFKLLTKKHRKLLVKQFSLMAKYIRILKSRIDDLGEQGNGR